MLSDMLRRFCEWVLRNDIERDRTERAEAVNSAIDWRLRCDEIRDVCEARGHALQAALATGPSVADAAVMVLGQRGLKSAMLEDAKMQIDLYRPYVGEGSFR